MKILGGEDIINTIKLPKLYTDVNYDITYGVQTLQVFASRVGDVFGSTGEYLAFGKALSVFSTDMIKIMLKL